MYLTLFVIFTTTIFRFIFAKNILNIHTSWCKIVIFVCLQMSMRFNWIYKFNRCYFSVVWPIIYLSNSDGLPFSAIVSLSFNFLNYEFYFGFVWSFHCAFKLSLMFCRWFLVSALETNNKLYYLVRYLWLEISDFCPSSGRLWKPIKSICLSANWA